MFTYFVGEEGTEFLKIGIAKNLLVRLGVMQTDNPRRLIFLGFLIGNHERHLREKFISSRIHGSEWHIKTPELLGFIEAKCRKPPSDFRLGVRRENRKPKTKPERRNWSFIKREIENKKRRERHAKSGRKAASTWQNYLKKHSVMFGDITSEDFKGEHESQTQHILFD